jgi:D-arabinose 1-dehydrogenase-like Zn-dependent alcohol dehydrogenase
VADGDSTTGAISALGTGGKLLLVVYAADTKTSFDIFDAIRRAITIHIGTAGNRVSFEALILTAERHQIRPAIAARYHVNEITEAMYRLEAGGQLGKIVLHFD